MWLSLNGKRLVELRILTVFFLVFAAGCGTIGTYNTATGRREFIAISTSHEITMGRDIHRNILQQYKLSEDQAMVERVRRIGQRLVLISDRQDYQYRFFVLENKELNAFTTPGGNIYMFSGLVNKLTTDEQIAGVLAHEIGHCAARHTAKKFQAALGYELLGGIILSQVQTGDQVKRVVSMSSDVLMGLIFSAYSRKDEFEADRLGVKYMYLAGYDLKGMIEILEVLQRESKGEGVPLILRSHPYLSDRIQMVKKEIEIIQKQYGPEPKLQGNTPGF